MRKLENLTERRMYMLDICQAVHDYCIANNVKYSLAYGTLIGAYRNGGFIPWDDDFDIMMTRVEFEKFLKGFNHPRYKCHTCYNSSNHYYAFARMIDTQTFQLSRRNLWGKCKKGPGINIDLYIIDDVPESNEDVKKLIKYVWKVVRLRIITKKFMNLLAKVKLRSDFGSFYPLTLLCRLQSKIVSSYKGNSNNTICFAGPVSNDTILNKSIFNRYTICKFENREFMTIYDYNTFLTKRYGDWLTPPPQEQRIPYHGGDYYTD